MNCSYSHLKGLQLFHKLEMAAGNLTQKVYLIAMVFTGFTYRSNLKICDDYSKNME